ncbi:RHS repeat domain-containing protein [Flagellimonas meishanensis]|uniref:RHS repeat domain-containing protein n=1 Tax=Flagellimonas meishanensis TaxID=2873264 RepID=UPI001CA6E8DE|nr:RHS repeat domain-containing protein [[Muricauda] meishanensis]
MKIRKLYITILGTMSTFLTIAQTNPGNIGPSSYEVQLVPGNPEVASLGKFGDTPVNKYNGTANINIPFHTVELDGLKIPINLQYNTSGVRFNQEASWVGLGWNLSEGIVITRQINGFDDLRVGSDTGNENQGWIYSEDLLSPTGPNDSQFKLDRDELFLLHTEYDQDAPRDLEPDLFTAHTPNGSVNFYLRKKVVNDTVITATTLGELNFKVDYFVNSKRFKVVDPMGFIYHFDQPELSTSFISNPNTTGLTEMDALNKVTGQARLHSRDLITSWKVSRIESPLNDPVVDNAVLRFYYSEGLHINFPIYNEISGFNSNAASFDRIKTVTTPQKISTSLSGNKILFLDEIQGDFGRLKFILGVREDDFDTDAFYALTNTQWNLSSYNPNNLESHSLQRINLYDYHNNLIKGAQFEYSYFNQDKQNQIDKVRFLRLKLDSFQIQDQKYIFDYECPNELPAKDTKGTDYWGFYNGMDSNTTRIANFQRFMLVPPTGNEESYEAFFKMIGADKSTNFLFGRKGILSKVIYPTGGTTEFVYEPNKTTLKKNYYTPTFNSGGGLKSSGLRSSKSYNFPYQLLKMADDSTYSFEESAYVNCSINTISINASQNGTTFQVVDTDLCDNSEYVDNQGNVLNIEVTATFGCAPNCDNITPVGQAIWIVNTATGENAINPIDFSSYSSSNLTRKYSLPIGNYKLYSTTWQSPSGTQAVYASAYATVWTGNAIDPPSDVYEEFEVGGARLAKIINKDVNGVILETKEYYYDMTFPDGGKKSSGVLMDDLIFWSPTSSLFEYSPDTAITFNSQDFSMYLSSENKLRTVNAASGSHIGYSKVTETFLDGTGASNGYKVSTYVNRPNDYIKRDVGLSHVLLGLSSGGCNPTIPGGYVEAEDFETCYDHYDVGYGEVYILGKLPNTNSHINGSVITDSIYSRTGELKQSIFYEYNEYDRGQEPFFNMPIMSWFKSGFLVPDPYEIISADEIKQGSIQRLKSSMVRTYFPNGIEENYTEYFYEKSVHRQLTKKVMRNSKGKILTSHLYYPHDVQSEANMPDLLAQNRTRATIRSEQFLADADESNEIKLFSQYTAYSMQTAMGNIPMPSSQISHKGIEDSQTNPTELRLLYEKYDGNGNLIQYRKADGAPVSLIWGYNGMYPIAQLENVEYDNIPNLGSIIANSNNDNDHTIGSNGQEGLLRGSLDGLRTNPNLSHAMITTYTYDPLIGVTSITDPRGYTIYYHYDANNRLKEVRDEQNNLITDYDYQYLDISVTQN